MSTIANLKINITATTHGLQKGLSKTRRAIRKFRSSLNKTFGQGVRIAMVAAAAAIGTVIMATKKMIAIFSEFEFKMQEVRSILLDVGDRTFARLEAQARKLGATTVFTASEAAQAMAFLARAGFNVNEVMAATPALLDLAAAATMDLAEAADITAQVVRGMGLEASEAGRVADVLAYTSARTNTTVQQLGHAFGYVAPVAAALNITLEETAAMLGVLSNAGMQADRAGTGLKNVLAELAGEIEAHGIAALKKFTEGGIGVQRAFDIFQKRGGPAIINLFKMHHITEKLVKEMEDVEGVARKMADIRMDSVHGAFKLLSSVVQELNIMIGEELRVSIRNIQEALRRWVVGFTGAIKAVIEKLDLANLTVEDMLGWLSKLAKKAEAAWDMVSRVGSAVIMVFHAVKTTVLSMILVITLAAEALAFVVMHSLEAIGITTEKTTKKAMAFFRGAYEEIMRQGNSSAKGVISNFTKIFEAENSMVSDFIADLEAKIRAVGNIPIIMTLDARVQMVTDPADIEQVEANIQSQIAALEAIEAVHLQGMDRGEMKGRMSDKFYEMQEAAEHYRGALREVENEEKNLNKLYEEEGKVLAFLQEFKRTPDAGPEKRRMDAARERLNVLKEMILVQEDATRSASAVTEALQATGAVQMEETFTNLEKVMDLFAKTDQLKATEVKGPPIKEVSQLQDVERDMGLVQEKMDELIAMPLSEKTEEWRQKYALLHEQMEGLVETQKGLKDIISMVPKKTLLDEMREDAEYLEDLILFEKAQNFPGLPTPAIMGMRAELDGLNSDIAGYIGVLAQVGEEHDRIVKVRGAWYDSEEIAVSETAIEDSIKDWKLVGQTLGMLPRQAEIFEMKIKGVSQATLDAAIEADKLLTELEEVQRIKDFGDEVRKSLEGPQEVFDKYIKDLNEALASGEISWRTHLLAKGKAEKDLAEDLGKATEGSVVGIQTALGTMKVGGASIAQKQFTTAVSSLQQQKLMNVNIGKLITATKPQLTTVGKLETAAEDAKKFDLGTFLDELLDMGKTSVEDAEKFDMGTFLDDVLDKAQTGEAYPLEGPDELGKAYTETLGKLQEEMSAYILELPMWESKFEGDTALDSAMERIDSLRSDIEVQNRMIETLEKITGVEVEGVEIDDGLSGVSDAVDGLMDILKKPPGEKISKQQEATAKDSLVQQKATTVKIGELVDLVRTGSGALT